jgi:hypothetical protein
MCALNEYFEDWASIRERTVGALVEFVGDETYAKLEFRRFSERNNAPDIIRYCLFKIEEDGQPQLFFLTDVCGQHKSRSPIEYVGADAVAIENSFLLGWMERGSKQNAVVIRFRTGELYSKEGRVCLNATLTYKDGPIEIANILGHWREAKSADGYSEGDCRRTLIAGMLRDGEFVVYEGIHLRGGVDTSPVAHVLEDFVACTVSVRVTDLFDPQFVCEGEFILTKEPLSIVPKDGCMFDSTEV